MRYARDSKVGDLVTAEQYLGRYSGVAAKQKPLLLCAHECCKAPVYVSDSKATAGFVAAGRSVTTRHRKSEGFSHKPRQASKNCPEYYPNDPRFEDLTEHVNSREVAKRNIEILIKDPVMRRRNRQVLSTLMTALCGRPAGEAEILRLKDVAKRVLTTEALGEHPYLFPYMMAALYGHQQRTTGRRDLVSLVGFGRQEVKYGDSIGTERVEVVPRELQLCFVNFRRGKPHYKAMVNPANQRPVHNFEISESAWRKLAGVVPEAPLSPARAPLAAPPAASVRIDVTVGGAAAAVASTQSAAAVPVKAAKRRPAKAPAKASPQMPLFKVSL